MKQHEGLRYNEGKKRYDLLHPKATEGLVDVLTRGAVKYEDRNWERGMSWSAVLASLKRHIAHFEAGEDYDPETGLLHIDHAQCNAHFLSAYYRIYPQGDDRRHRYLDAPKIGLDVDEVLADFSWGYMKRYGIENRPSAWYFDVNMQRNMEELWIDKEFWLNLVRITEPIDIPFEPDCYISSRKCPVEWTEEWLQTNGFPIAPVIHTFGESKVKYVNESDVDIFVDDSYHNFVQLNKAGICTFLFDAVHNDRYDVGYKRIYELKELSQWLS